MRLVVMHMATENVERPGFRADPTGQITNLFHYENEAQAESEIMQCRSVKGLPRPGVVTVVLLIQEEEG